jgi:DNA-binding NarL/FixJ family response regulator
MLAEEREEESRMITILLADDHALVRDGLRALLEREQDMQLVAEASDGRQAVELAKEMRPDVALIDAAMPVLNGIEATRQIASALPDTKIIALSMHSDRRFVSGMLTAGAVGFVLKECAYEELIEGVRAVINNQTFLSAKIVNIVTEGFVAGAKGAQPSPCGQLTQREREVLQLLVEGKTTKEIAEGLDVSVKTVETHRRHIMEKLDMRSVAELTKFAIREGMTGL